MNIKYFIMFIIAFSSSYGHSQILQSKTLKASLVIPLRVKVEYSADEVKIKSNAKYLINFKKNNFDILEAVKLETTHTIKGTDDQTITIYDIN